jgi:hypothetical protein
MQLTVELEEDGRRERLFVVPIPDPVLDLELAQVLREIEPLIVDVGWGDQAARLLTARTASRASDESGFET